MVPDEPSLLPLIDQIYAASLDPARWGAFLDSFTEAFHGQQATFFSHDLRDGRASFHAHARVEDSFLQSYLDHYAETNFFVEKSAQVAEGRFLSTDDMADRATYAASEFYNDWVRPQGGLEFATTNILRDRTVLTGVTVLRGRTPFGPAETARWMALVPHLRRAVQVHRALVSAELVKAGCLGALDRLTVGVILTDEAARILFANRVAERILAAGAGLRGQGGSLCGETLGATSLIRGTIREAARTGAGRGTEPGGLLALPRRAGPAMPVLVSPLHVAGALAATLASTLAGAVAGQGALVLVADPQADRSAQGTELARVFGLTGAEARLLMGLVEGRSLQECAPAAGISVQTARSQLKRIFDKTGERRQSDLIRLVLTNPVVARARPCEE